MNNEQLNVFLKENFIGKSVIRVTVDSESVFHLGTPEKYLTRRMKDKVRGSHQIRILHSPWKVLKEKEVINENLEKLFDKSSITEIYVNNFSDLFIFYSNNYRVETFCGNMICSNEQIMWKIVTPNESICLKKEECGNNYLCSAEGSTHTLLCRAEGGTNK